MKDYDLKARLLEGVAHNINEAAVMYEKALALAEVEKVKLAYMETLLNLYNETKNTEKEAALREKIYTTKESPTNLDLYYWGVSLYSNADYNKSDSVFSIYAEKYPEQVFGYLWRAKSVAQIDSTMELGLAIPYYEKVIEVAKKDPENNLSNLISAYGYIGAYKANIEKDFAGSLDCFTKILQLDKDNSDAMRYSEILKQWIDKANIKEDEMGSKEKKTSSIN